MNTKKIVFLAVMLSIAIVVSIVESMIPLFWVPGAKLGLANIVTLVVLYVYGKKDAFILLVLRILLVGLLRGTFLMPGFFLSVSGGLLAYIMMISFMRMKVFSIIGVSVTGSLGHSLGQILMAVVLLSTPELIYYFPVIFFISIPTGIFTGYVSMVFLDITKNALHVGY
ncbi:MAG: Gx transporter family protein [Candidatus Izemoplasmataceae bacterium]